MLKAKDLRQEGPEELEMKLDTLKKEIFQLRGQRGDTGAKKTHLIRQKRKEIARILTVKKESEKRV